jgi:hypothetical protein
MGIGIFAAQFRIKGGSGVQAFDLGLVIAFVERHVTFVVHISNSLCFTLGKLKYQRITHASCLQ